MDRVQRLAVKASRLPPSGRRTGVTGVGCEIWIELAQGWARRFGVVVVKLLELGLVTPPIGLNVFVIKSIVDKKIALETIFKGVSLFLVAEIVVLALIITVPALSLYLALSL